MPSSFNEDAIACVDCGSQRSTVTNSRDRNGTRRRTRQCKGCGAQYHTREITEFALVEVEGIEWVWEQGKI